MSRILLVDDDPQALDSTRKILEFSGYEVSVATDGQMALESVRPSSEKNVPEFDLILTDVRMPRLGGLEFLRALSLCGKKMPVILMTAFGRVEDAVWAMKLGAVDFLTKPFKRQALLNSVTAALKRTGGGRNLRLVTPVAVSNVEQGELLIGRSGVMQDMRAVIERVAPTHAAILLTGESGTGKELVARYLHHKGPRSTGKFVAVNCAAVP